MGIKLNGKEVIFGMFPNKEFNLPIKDLIIDVKGGSVIEWAFEDNNDFIKLAILNQYLKGLNIPQTLKVKYLPYSRMDRPNGYYAVSLKAVATLINSMNFENIWINDPHSTESLKLINDSVAFTPFFNFFEEIFYDYKINTIYFPDSGAKERYSCNFKEKLNIIYGKKTRDFNTGEIIGFDIIGNKIGDSILIIDDICSKGGTFIRAAEELKKREKSPTFIYLFVTNCEDNIFNGEIFNYIDRIFTVNLMSKRTHPRITILK